MAKTKRAWSNTLIRVFTNYVFSFTSVAYIWNDDYKTRSDKTYYLFYLLKNCEAKSEEDYFSIDIVLLCILSSNICLSGVGSQPSPLVFYRVVYLEAKYGKINRAKRPIQKESNCLISGFYYEIVTNLAGQITETSPAAGRLCYMPYYESSHPILSYNSHFVR